MQTSSLIFLLHTTLFLKQKLLRLYFRKELWQQMGKNLSLPADSSSKYIHAVLLQINIKANLLKFLTEWKNTGFGHF